MNRWLLAVLLSAPAAAVASSDDQGFYLGFGAGEANVDLTEDLGVLDDTRKTWRLYGGYEFNRHFAAEAGYLKVDDLRGSFASIEGPVFSRVKLDGFTAGLNSRVELGSQWFAQAQLGVLFWQADASVDGPVGSFRARANDQDPYYGLSVGRDLGRNWRLLGQWTRYETDGSDFDFLNVAMTYRLKSS